MAIQLLGADGTTLLAVDPQFQAQRVSLRPMQNLSWNSVGAQSGALTAAGANTPIFSFRNLSANPIVIRRAGVGFITITAFTAGQIVDYGLMVARAFTVSDSGGTAIALIGNNAKHRTNLGTLTSVDCRIATTTALTAGTKTLDTNHLSQVGAFSSAIGVSLTPGLDNLLSNDAGDHPLILAQNEGINVMNITAMGTAGVIRAYVNLEIAEVTSY